MKKESLSLLDQIKSKYILQKILCLAYGEMKSVVKLVKYNKSLLNKLQIDIKENYKYNCEIELNIEKKNLFILFFILFLLIFHFL